MNIIGTSERGMLLCTDRRDPPITGDWNGTIQASLMRKARQMAKDSGYCGAFNLMFGLTLVGRGHTGNNDVWIGPPGFWPSVAEPGQRSIDLTADEAPRLDQET